MHRGSQAVFKCTSKPRWVKALIGLAALAFVLAVLTHFTGPIVRTQPEAYSRASANLQGRVRHNSSALSGSRAPEPAWQKPTVRGILR
jgi:hypothetical protein